MSSTAITHDPSAAGLSAGLMLLLATGAGLAAATLYYSQPMLGILGTQFQATPGDIGLVPTLTQLGYALGIWLLAPLGDRYDRRRIILCKGAALTLALLAAASAPTLAVLMLASLAIGLSATLAQDIVPATAALAQSAHRGKMVGMVMTGLLLGILLSRVVSGFVAEQFGWRSMFVAAAISIALLNVAVWFRLPRFVPSTQLSYGALLGSLWTLLRRYSALRRAALAQGLMSVGFSAFWSTLAVMLHAAPFHMGSSAIGAFGLAGAAGALAAPLAGRMADRKGPEQVTRLGAVLLTMAFVAMACGPDQLWLLVVGAVVFDLGTQATLVAHQAIIYSLDSQARSRLNAVLFVGMFTGMSSGAYLGSLVLARFGWQGVCVLAALSGVAALLVRMWPTRLQGK
ncbi:transporter [Rhodoferax lithotrophicus]|uniref:Transporter n=1 Tax=Rhodoferax lithotrophicus TaxID=2798804 RepID=A0ABN6D1U5_9BURK|nr:MFS transporter [Rhodoferax sp. MIZ03]BCO25438.1 transporter [Rhodoferax sp. MIZ03]